MDIRIVAEIGSCHLGKLSYAKEAVDRCVDIGADAIKFQLFPRTDEYLKSGNVWLDPSLYLEIADYAKEQNLDCSASVFDQDNFDFLLKTHPPFIKFAYSQKHQIGWIEETLSEGIEAIVSCDAMTDYMVPKEATKLYCISEYPVKYKISFEGIFPRFHGFSSHCLGFEQDLDAVQAGAKIIEKHFSLNHLDIRCPDSYFALKISEFQFLVESIRRIEKA